jgi:hypothetical protein
VGQHRERAPVAGACWSPGADGLRRRLLRGGAPARRAAARVRVPVQARTRYPPLRTPASWRHANSQRPRAPGRRGQLRFIVKRGASPPVPHRAAITEMRSSDPDQQRSTATCPFDRIHRGLHVQPGPCSRWGLAPPCGCRGLGPGQAYSAFPRRRPAQLRAEPSGVRAGRTAGQGHLLRCERVAFTVAKGEPVLTAMAPLRWPRGTPSNAVAAATERY